MMSSGPNVDVEDLNWLIVGLGNPGERYERTRHNVGFLVADELARRASVQIKRLECQSLVGRFEYEREVAELVKPQTFMNLSGEAVKCLLHKIDRGLERMIVVVDDLALPFGSIRLRKKGSAGGHNGLKSIIGSTGTDEFGRLRIGIAPEHPVANTKKFVLDSFPAGDSAEVVEIVERSADAVLAVIRDGFESAMSEFNG
ncbi:MAG: aminoacyl-tRNA hydrolase [Acidobacteria bacterium]|nr:MAG: aminoacyl-tRNA hydrolase [Acidobacteriota bacterium]REK01306.1 MAG: aminoacyl-tRNA hydrolase [Acidobacteriota bacterium]REK14262.1 MAG: aminoacyl-tRNA hydrolase [Acidobacteriota bacterium]REK44977.1 MAG: aminoacyl-tRNA hydrolase [Acidobacteriota bacterium]